MIKQNLGRKFLKPNEVFKILICIQEKRGKNVLLRGEAGNEDPTDLEIYNCPQTFQRWTAFHHMKSKRIFS
jgi:hypothetical protein